MAEARIDVVIGSAQAQSGANAVKSAVDGVKASFLDLSAKVFVAEQAIEKVWRLAKNGAEFEETMTRLNRQMGAFHGTGQQMVNDLVAISQATLSIDKAASMASRALAIGLDPSQIRTFTEAADALDEVMGTDLPTAFDQIVQAAITGRSQILANIGVYVDLEDEVKKLAVSTGRTTEQITKQERAMIAAKAITTQAGDALHKLSDGSLSDAKRLEQVEAKWNNLWLTIGRGAKNAVVSAIDALEEIGAYMRKQAEEQAKREKAPPTEVAPFGKFFNDPIRIAMIRRRMMNMWMWSGAPAKRNSGNMMRLWPAPNKLGKPRSFKGSMAAPLCRMHKASCLRQRRPRSSSPRRSKVNNWIPNVSGAPRR